MKLEELELPLRPLNVLHGVGIMTFADLVRRSEAELLALKNFGRKDVLLLREKLAALDLKFGMVRGRGHQPTDTVGLEGGLGTCPKTLGILRIPWRSMPMKQHDPRRRVDAAT